MKTETSTSYSYLTGFENLTLVANHTDLSEAVISSVIPFDGELLVVGQSDACATWKSICHQMKINVSTIDLQDNDNDIETAVTAILSANKHITHIICGADRSETSLSTIGSLARQFRRSLVVDNTSNSLVVSDMNKYCIDFLIASCGIESTILARRSKLVQTEGNARIARHDIYAMWQNDMRVRRATLEPMAC